MLALQITSMKNFMSQLLAGDAFDIFLLEEASISTANTYTIDGRMNKDFFSSDELAAGSCPYEFQPWSEAKGLCFHLIKGKHTPLFFKFVLHLKPDLFSRLPNSEDTDLSPVKSLVLTIRYDGSKAVVTTGASYHTFVLSKEADILWDKAVNSYLASKDIAFETLG